MKHNRILQRDYVVSFSPVCPSAFACPVQQLRAGFNWREQEQKIFSKKVAQHFKSLKFSRRLISQMGHLVRY